MTDFGALGYLEGRQLLNTLKDVIKKPQRLLLYVFIALYFAFLIWSRTLAHGAAIPGIPDPWATLIGLGLVFLAGLQIFRSAGGHIAAFSSAAEARFLVGSRLSERNVTLWLQLRNSGRTLVRLLFVIVLYAVVFHGAGQPLAIALSMTCVIIAGIALAIPVFKLRQRIGERPCQIIAGVLAALALIGAGIVAWGYLAPHPHGLRHLIALWGPGYVIRQALFGNGAILGTGFAIDAVLIGLAYFGATDIYPELNVGSARYIQALARGRRGAFANIATRSASAGTNVTSVSAPSGFTGAASLLWKDWLSTRRANVTYYAFLALLGGSLVGGVAFGIWSISGRDGRTSAIPIALSLGAVIVAVGAMSSNISLADDIGKPLWWLSASTVRSRLYVWTIARSWRSIACVILGLLGWSVVAGMPIVAELGIPVSIVISFFARGTGLALYSIFPSTLDQRGPLAIGRMLGMYVSLIPPAAAGLTFGLVTQSPLDGIIAGALVAALEFVGLVEFAAWRIQTAGVAIAQAEAN